MIAFMRAVAAIQKRINQNKTSSAESVPQGFPSEYASWLPDAKNKYASKQAHTKVKRLAYLLYPSIDEKERGEKIKEIHNKAKLKNGLSPKSFIGHEGWEQIYVWACNRIAEAAQLKGTEDS